MRLKVNVLKPVSESNMIFIPEHDWILDGRLNRKSLQNLSLPDMEYYKSGVESGLRGMS